MVPQLVPSQTGPRRIAGAAIHQRDREKEMETLRTNLRKGDSGAAVKTVQNALIRWGYRLQPDSKYGTGTQTAVRSFQIHRCLLPTGIVDQDTFKALQTERPAHPPGALQNPVPRANRQNLFGLAATIDPCVYQAAFMAQFRPTPRIVSAPVNGFCLSQKGYDFIYKLETFKGRSERLHYPGGASGVTLGPGYDMKERGPEEIVRDLMAIGIDREVAKKASKAGGLKKRAEIDPFVETNKNLITLTRECPEFCV
jgi:hypothetical protein